MRSVFHEGGSHTRRRRLTDIDFDLEDTIVLGDRAIVLWRLRWGAADDDSVRGVNLMRLHDGRIVEALGYVKGA